MDTRLSFGIRTGIILMKGEKSLVGVAKSAGEGRFFMVKGAKAALLASLPTRAFFPSMQAAASFSSSWFAEYFP